jgi:hypothetical protein
MMSLDIVPRGARKWLVLCWLLLASVSLSAQYTAGDYGSWASGPWNTAATWRIYNGTSWATSPAAGTPPNSTHTVWIRGGTTVTAVFGTVYHCRNLIVEAGGKLFNNDTGPTNLSYVTIYGTTLRCDGVIGNSPTLDGISFNIEGLNVLLDGSGQFEAARIRKNFSSNPVTGEVLANTNLTIDMDIMLRFSGGSNTMIYNNFDGTTLFNVTINAGRTVTLNGAVGFGNIAIDGVDGNSTHARGGHFTINGALLIPGVLYLTTNNTSIAQQCRVTIGSTGYVRCNQINSNASGTAGHVLTINSGGQLEITGAPAAWTIFSTTNNTFALASGSRVTYSGAGIQDVRPVPGGYGHLRITGTGVKSLGGITLVKNDLEILNTTGTPELDVTVSNFQLSVQGNWINYSTAGFNQRNGLVQFSGTASAQAITTPGGEDFHNWRIVKSALQPLVQMNSEVRVANVLELNTAAILDLNGNRLVISNPAATAIATSSTFGTLRHIRSERTDNASRVRWDIGTATGAHLVPFGTTAAYTPFTFNLVSGDAGQVTMSTYGTPASNLPWPTTPALVTNLQSSLGLMPDNRDATVDRFWQVDVTGAPLAHLTFSYAASELPIAPWNDPFSMRAQRWNDAIPMWEDQLESGGASAYWAIANNVTAFGPFTLTPILSPLPVELLSFTAEPQGDAVLLEWLTASERGSDHFVVLRSADGFRFEEVTRLDAMGNSAALLSYEAIDAKPLDGLSFYQLKQVDLDGAEAYSDLVPVRRASAVAAQVFPNPATDRVSVMLADGKAAGTVALLDGAGRVLLQERIAGGRAELMVTDLPRGTYLLRSADGCFAAQRVILH